MLTFRINANTACHFTEKDLSEIELFFNTKIVNPIYTNIFNLNIAVLTGDKSGVFYRKKNKIASELVGFNVFGNVHCVGLKKYNNDLVYVNLKSRDGKRLLSFARKWHVNRFMKAK